MNPTTLLKLKKFVRFRSTLVNLNFSEEIVNSENSAIKPYSAIPGPKEYPIIGNSWRFAPLIGNFLIYINYFGFRPF